MASAGKSDTYDGKGKRLYIVTYGCQMNDRDSEILYGLLLERGWRRAESEEDADCVLINTCSVREHAEHRAYSNLGRLAKEKRHGKRKRILGFIGCTAQKDKGGVFERIPGVNLVAGPGNIYDIPDYLDAIMRGEERVLGVDKKERPDRKNPAYRESQTRAYVSISEGCDNFCSYCIVPYVRGRQRSRPKALILDEVRGAVEAGLADMTLLGQNVNSYGKDTKGGADFVSLLTEVHAIAGVKKIRFVTCHPKDTADRLFIAMKELPKVYKHLHLPLQSGSDKILGAMRRGYTASHYLGLIDRLRSRIPDCNLTTDIIVGFPGETETDFNETIKVVEKIRFDSAYIFKYSPRPPALSARFADDVGEEVKRRRHARLLKLQKKIAKERREEKGVEPMAMA